MTEFRFLPTKVNLLRLKEELKLAQEGVKLLDRKREVLIRELFKVGFEIKDVKKRVGELLEKVYEKYHSAKSRMGAERISFFKLFKREHPKIIFIEKSIMGVHIPHLVMKEEVKIDFPSPLFSCKEFDEFVKFLLELFPLLLSYVELNFSLFKIAEELFKIQKRLRALENIFIPEFKEKIKFIEEVLEENEKENFFRSKLIKTKRRDNV